MSLLPNYCKLCNSEATEDVGGMTLILNAAGHSYRPRTSCFMLCSIEAPEHLGNRRFLSLTKTGGHNNASRPHTAANHLL